MSKSVISVAKDAFKNNLTIISAKFGEQCESVGSCAFEGCTSLSEINEDNKLINIEDSAFKDCSNLTSIDIPICEQIGQNAFEGCTELTSVNINNENGYILGANVFNGCSKLSDVNFNKCTSMGDSAFENCTSLNESSLNICEYIGNNAFKECNNLSQVSLYKCNTIGKYAFLNCKNLKKVYVHNEKDIFCELLDENVFCTKEDGQNYYKIIPNIRFIFRPNTIEDYRNDDKWKKYFDYMSMAQNNQIIYVSKNNNTETLHEDLTFDTHYYDKTLDYGLIQFANKIEDLNFKIFDKNSKNNITYIDIPSDCTEIGSYVFEGYTSLESISLPNSLKYILQSAFEGCTSLKSISLPDSLTDISQSAFEGCTSLKSISLPDNIKSIGSEAFLGCTSLESISLPNSLTYIYQSAFEGCTSLKSNITIPNNLLTLYDCCFKNTGIQNLIIPKECKNLKSINKEAFYGCKNLSSVKINSDYITSIEEYAFSYCGTSTSDFSVILNNGIEYIGDEAFKGCKTMHYVLLPENLSRLGNECFNNGGDLKIYITSFKNEKNPIPKFSQLTYEGSQLKVEETIDSNPFGDPDNTKVIIYVQTDELYNQLIVNDYWGKYENIIKSPDEWNEAYEEYKQHYNGLLVSE